MRSLHQSNAGVQQGDQFKQSSGYACRLTILRLLLKLLNSKGGCLFPSLYRSGWFRTRGCRNESRQDSSEIIRPVKVPSYDETEFLSSCLELPLPHKPLHETSKRRPRHNMTHRAQPLPLPAITTDSEVCSCVSIKEKEHRHLPSNFVPRGSPGN